MKLIFPHFLVLRSEQKDSVSWKGQSLKGWHETAQIVVLHVESKQVLENSRLWYTWKKKITSAFHSAHNSNLCRLLLSSRIWGLIKREVTSILWFLWLFYEVWATICLVQLDGRWEPLEMLVWASESPCEYPCSSPHDCTGDIASWSLHKFLTENRLKNMIKELDLHNALI